MKVFSLCFVFFGAICFTSIAQTNSLIVNSDIVMPEDSIESEALLSSVNAFLFSAYENSPNNWVWPTERVETQVLIDEIQDIQKNETLEDDSFYKGYLTNLVVLDDNKYAVHIAYIGISDNSAVVRANFELIAHRAKEVFLISSPLVWNTQNWKTQEIKNFVFHYPYSLNSEKVEEFSEFASFYDEKLKNIDGVSNYYLCAEEIDPLKLFGVEYKSDYNGWELNDSWVSTVDKKSLFVGAASDLNDFNTHDLWHNTLSQVISRKEVNRNVDCNIACIYGGCWGNSWEELFPQFCKKFVVGKNIDWYEHWRNKSHFTTNDGRRKNYTNDFVGGLIIKKVEGDKGWDAVWKLLMTKGHKEYFVLLEEFVGISKANYNQEVFKLIEGEMTEFGIDLVSQ